MNKSVRVGLEHLVGYEEFVHTFTGFDPRTKTIKCQAYAGVPIKICIVITSDNDHIVYQDRDQYVLQAGEPLRRIKAPITRYELRSAGLAQ